MILQSSRLLLLHNIPFIENHFYNVQVNAMRKVFRFASLPSITSYIRYYWKRKYVYACTHECLCVCWSHIILIHYSLHQNVNTHILILKKKTYYYKTVFEPRQHPSLIPYRAFSSVFLKRFHFASLILSLFFFLILFGFISHDVSRLQKGYREQSLLMHA